MAKTVENFNCVSFSILQYKNNWKVYQQYKITLAVQISIWYSYRLRNDRMLKWDAYTLFARATLTVWTSEMWEDFWIMRLVRAGLAVQLCVRAEVGPVTHILSVMVVLVTEKGSRVQLWAVPELGTLILLWSSAQLCPWARLVRATAAWISLQPWLTRLCWPRSCCRTLNT